MSTDYRARRTALLARALDADLAQQVEEVMDCADEGMAYASLIDMERMEMEEALVSSLLAVL